MKHNSKLWEHRVALAMRAWWMRDAGLTLREIGLKLKCSRERARQRANRGERIMEGYSHDQFLKERFVEEFIVDRNPVNAVERVLARAMYPADLAEKWMSDEYVASEINKRLMRIRHG